MGAYRTKEDDVAKISTSIYVTNFSKSINAKELFHACKAYGHVLDSFIPNKRAKNGDVKSRDVESKSQAPMVLDDECLISRDLSKALMCRVKVFASLANLRVMLKNKGFLDVKIQYLGEYWVMLEFASTETMMKFQDCVSIGSWFFAIKTVSVDFQLPKQIAWVEVEGVPFKLWMSKTFCHIANKWGDLLDVDDEDDNCFHSKRLCLHTKTDRSISEEFKIIHRGFTYWVRANEVSGWVPDFNDDSDEEEQDDNNGYDDEVKMREQDVFGDESDDDRIPKTMPQDDVQDVKNMEEGEIPLNDENSFNGSRECHDMGNDTGMNDNFLNCKIKKQVYEGSNVSLSSGHFKLSERPSIGGSILDLLEEVVKVGQVMGYKMEGCVSNIAEIIETQGAEEAENVTVSDSLVILYGTWHPTGQKYLLITVYAPHDAREKNMLWDYLHYVIDRWKGETLLNKRPNISAVSLDRLMSGHRPILLREVYVDYGPIPFKCFHYWFDIDGFSKIVEDGWNEYEGKEGNKMRHLMAKFKHLKSRIKEWYAASNECNKKESDQCKRDLEAIDAIIDNRNREDEDVCKRTYIINKLYKIANRLTGVLDGIVNGVQSAFVADRQILDGPFILNEVIQWCKTKKKQALIIKIDFEKAYDSVRWDFVDEVLRKFGFRDKWCKWIQGCFSSSRGSIIVNGSPTEEIQFGRGLKQVDPLSPFLFILNMESLHLSFQRIVDAGMFQGIKLDGGLVNLSHMFFANDAVFVGQWCENNITTLTHVLEYFHKEINVLMNKGINVMQYLRRKVRNGEDTKFWEDKWCDGGKLKDRFHRLYALEANKQITVGRKMAQITLSSSFRRNPRSGIEMEQFANMVNLVKETSLNTSANGWLWELEK
nr:RNA-directed DNA polymerase, eukaryota [Tanacetum cinerariifolium]